MVIKPRKPTFRTYCIRDKHARLPVSKGLPQIASLMRCPIRPHLAGNYEYMSSM